MNILNANTILNKFGVQLLEDSFDVLVLGDRNGVQYATMGHIVDHQEDRFTTPEKVISAGGELKALQRFAVPVIGF